MKKEEVLINLVSLSEEDRAWVMKNINTQRVAERKARYMKEVTKTAAILGDKLKELAGVDIFADRTYKAQGYRCIVARILTNEEFPVLCIANALGYNNYTSVWRLNQKASYMQAHPKQYKEENKVWNQLNEFYYGRN